MTKQISRKKFRKLFTEVMVSKASELRDEVLQQLNKMPLHKRISFAIRVLLKRV